MCVFGSSIHPGLPDAMIDGRARHKRLNPTFCSVATRTPDRNVVLSITEPGYPQLG